MHDGAGAYRAAGFCRQGADDAGPHQHHGRAALNIVCGYNQPELAMFGISQFDRAYERGREWYDVLMRVYQSDQPFDYHGEFYHLKGVEGAPRPLQQAAPGGHNRRFLPGGTRFRRAYQ